MENPVKSQYENKEIVIPFAQLYACCKDYPNRLDMFLNDLKRQRLISKSEADEVVGEFYQYLQKRFPKGKR